MDQNAPAEVRAALFEFRRYLSDQVAPLIVVDSIETLLRYSPTLAFAEIQAWTANQFHGRGAEVPVSDYLYHAMKKMKLFEELNILPKLAQSEYLAELKELVIEACPPEDRDLLRRNIELLDVSADSPGAPVDILHRQAGTEGRLAVAAEGSISDRAARSLTQVTGLLQRMQFQGALTAPGASQDRTQLSSLAISAAALGAANGQEFQTLLSELQARGIDTRNDRLFHSLSASLPSWVVPVTHVVSDSAPADDFDTNPLQAMHRIISMAEDPSEGARRFSEMLDAAIAQFNSGDLPRAATMFDLAERIIAEKRVDDSIVSKVRATAHQKLDGEALRQAIGQKEKHFLLRRIFRFFPKFSPTALLAELEVEEKRDRRRSLLAFLEVHGQPARELALEKLLSVPESGDSADPYLVRNLLYVLNRVPRVVEGSTDKSTDKEIDTVAAFTTLSNRGFVIKEALTVMAQIRNDRSERIILNRLRDLETALIKGGGGKNSAAEMRQLLDRVISSLIRVGTGTAIAAVVEHGLKTEELLGDTRGRLAALSAIDLSEYPDVVSRLIACTRSELPKKVLGIVAGKKQPQLLRLLDVLSSTPSPDVRELLEEILQKFSNRDFTEKATAILDGFGASRAHAASGAPAAEPTAAPSLAGDLELFGLLNLLQSLSESAVTGTLILSDPEGVTEATLKFDGGRITFCQTRLLRGREALFQLFERPGPGGFAFYARTSKPEEGDFDPPLEVTPLIMEAMRRFDELRRGRLLVPETVTLRATGTKPVPLPSETDPGVVREVWTKAASGAKPADWESHVSADSYRIWRLLVHWVESGALEIVAPAA